MKGIILIDQNTDVALHYITKTNVKNAAGKVEERWKNIHSLLISSYLTTLFPVYYTLVQPGSTQH